MFKVLYHDRVDCKCTCTRVCACVCTLVSQVGNLELLKVTQQWEVGIGLLQKLRHFDASHNELEQFPLQIDKCGSLMTLQLAHNKLKSVPEIAGDMSSLQLLDLSYNDITEFDAKVRAKGLECAFTQSDDCVNPTPPPPPPSRRCNCLTPPGRSAQKFAHTEAQSQSTGQTSASGPTGGRSIERTVVGCSMEPAVHLTGRNCSVDCTDIA